MPCPEVRALAHPTQDAGLHHASHSNSSSLRSLTTRLQTHIRTHTSAKSLQSCPTLCNPRDSSPPASPVPGILQAKTLEWVAIAFSRTHTYTHTMAYKTYVERRQLQISETVHLFSDDYIPDMQGSRLKLGQLHKFVC